MTCTCLKPGPAKICMSPMEVRHVHHIIRLVNRQCLRHPRVYLERLDKLESQHISASGEAAAFLSVMATLDVLKKALRQKGLTTRCSAEALSDSQYEAGWEIFGQISARPNYQDFVIPQLSRLLSPLVDTHDRISILEIGPGPESVLGSLPSYLRKRIKRYVAFEPNRSFSATLEHWLCSTQESKCPIPNLDSPPDIHNARFTIREEDVVEKFDVVLFCHSLYGMKPKTKFIRQALRMLVDGPKYGVVMVFHRDHLLLEGLTCHQTTAFPTGTVCVADKDNVLDIFATFIAGFVVEEANETTKIEWRKTCRALGCRQTVDAQSLQFSCPEIMATFTQHSITLPELRMSVPSFTAHKKVKNREARLQHPAAVVKPTDIGQVQACIRWALKHRFSLTVVGGGHSGHCLQSNIVAVDMGAFDQIEILTSNEESSPEATSLVVGSGCRTEDVIRKTMEADLTVPLGSRPSVGAGLWLQGGIGHLARQYGLTTDSILGAVLVSVASGEILCVGHVPDQHQPKGSIYPENSLDILWAIKGAGTNVGIVINVIFKAHPAMTFSVRNWVLPLNDKLEARSRLSSLDKSIAKKLPRYCSIDMYLYWDVDKLRLGINIFQTLGKTGPLHEIRNPIPMSLYKTLGPEAKHEFADGIDLFETEMYMSAMHGGHGTGKTSSFKRCVFLSRIGAPDVSERLLAAIESRPSPFCYLHLLQGGGAIREVADDATAFGCRDWDFACIITGVWPREQDGTEIARLNAEWVYHTTESLLPLSNGAYSADLGPDSRDTALAAKALGPNLTRLARIKRMLDPADVLTHTCPIPTMSIRQKLIILVTGDSCAGKDHCAHVWAPVLTMCSSENLTARVVEISDETKRAYAAATGADPQLLQVDRAYKERHRPALTRFFQDQLKERPQLREEHFVSVCRDIKDIDVLFITGMRDEAPAATFSHLVPQARLLEVRIEASRELRCSRKPHDACGDQRDNEEHDLGRNNSPCLIFQNNTIGDEEAIRFCQRHLLPFFHEDIQRLTAMVRQVPNFPCPGIEFHDVLGIAQRPGGLVLCTSLLQSHFTDDWSRVDAMVCCEAGGFVFASALAARVDVPLILAREEGKLPPPMISVIKSPSHISSSTAKASREKRIEMGRGVIREGASVVVVDDVLATGETLCALLELLREVGVEAEDVRVLVVAEFPVHRGRDLLRRRGFGSARIQSLLVFEGS